MTESTALAAQNADLGDIVALLETRRTRRVDVVAPARSLVSADAAIRVTGVPPEMELDGDGMPVGFNPVDGLYLPTRVADDHLAERLRIPPRYLRELRGAGRLWMYDENVNGMIHGREFAEGKISPTDSTWLLRLLRSDDGEGPGVLRAVLSDRYKMIDDLDVLLSVLEGLDAAGVDAETSDVKLDLTERRMYGRVVVPAIEVMAPELLKGYRSPFGAVLDSKPVIQGGIAFGNSEVGHGGFSISPYLRVLVCRNGQTITADALRKVHVGGRLEEGAVNWSDDTQKKALELVKAQTRDAVASFLDVDYVARKVAEMEKDAGVEVSDPVETIKVVSKRFTFSEDRQASILTKFIKGGQLTAGGVMQAVTAEARDLRERTDNPDADLAAELEALATDVLSYAATNAK